MASFEGLLGWFPLLIGVAAFGWLVVGIVFLSNKRRAQRRLAAWNRQHEGDSGITDPGNSPARALIAASLADPGHMATKCDADTFDSGCDSGGSDGGGGGGD
jgi:hypothetical protein